MVKRYIWNLLISIDQLANTLLGGYPDETISSRMGKSIARNENCPVCHLLCKILNFFDKNHCEKSIEHDEGKPL